MNSIIQIAFVFSFLLLCNCSAIVNNTPLSKVLGVQPIIEPIDQKSSAIAITIDQNFRRKPLVEEKLEIKKVFFIKLKENNDSLMHNNILSSNYYFKPFMVGFQADAVDNFLLNVTPGFYAAVGASADGIFLYFPKEVIRRSIVEVKPQEMVYMGEFKLDKISYKKRAEPDDHQMYYRMQFGGGISSKASVISHRSIPQYYAPKTKAINRSNNLESNFLSAYKKRFADTKWRYAIENRLIRLREEAKAP